MTDTTTTPAPLTADERAYLQRRLDTNFAVAFIKVEPIRRLWAALVAAEQRATDAEAQRADLARHHLDVSEVAVEREADLRAALAAERAARERAERWSALWKETAGVNRRESRARFESWMREIGLRRQAKAKGDALAREVGALREALENLIGAFTTHRTETHRVDPMACRTCQESVKALTAARAALAGGRPDEGGEG